MQSRRLLASFFFAHFPDESHSKSWRERSPFSLKAVNKKEKPRSYTSGWTEGFRGRIDGTRARLAPGRPSYRRELRRHEPNPWAISKLNRRARKNWSSIKPRSINKCVAHTHRRASFFIRERELFIFIWLCVLRGQLETRPKDHLSSGDCWCCSFGYSRSPRFCLLTMKFGVSCREWLQRINALNNAGQYPRAMDLVSGSGHLN